jgi:bacteriorhodopsin
MSKKNRESQPALGAAAKPAAGSRFSDYFWANLIFFGFLFVLAFIVRASCESPSDDASVRQAVGLVLDETFKFFLLLMGGGFLLVTLFDAAYEHYNAQASQDGEGGGAA